MNTKAKGYLLGAVAAATYGMNPLFALPLYKAGMDPDSVLFFRYLFAIPLLGIMLKARGRDFKLHRREIVPLVLLGIAGRPLVPVLVPELQLHGCRHRLDAAVRISYFRSVDHGLRLPGEALPADCIVHLAGIGRYRAVVQRQ